MGMFPPLLVCNHCRKTRQRQLTYTACWATRYWPRLYVPAGSGIRTVLLYPGVKAVGGDIETWVMTPTY